MARFKITGVVMPETMSLTIPDSFRTEICLDCFSDKLRIDTSITAGRFTADCYTEKIGRDRFRTVLNYVEDFLSAQLWLVTLGSGVVLNAVPQQVACDDEPSEPIVFTFHDVARHFPLLNADATGKIDFSRFSQLLGILFTEPGLIVAVRAFRHALGASEQRTVACARSIEALRNSMFSKDPSEKERGEAWALFRENLAVSRSFLESCMNPAKTHRHGSSAIILPETGDLVLERTTMIFYRYFQFRLSGSVPLTEPEYPML